MSYITHFAFILLLHEIKRFMNGDLMNMKTPRRSDRSSGVFEKMVVCSRLWGKKSGRSILSEFKKIVVYNGRIPISTANSMQRIEKIHT